MLTPPEDDESTKQHKHWWEPLALLHVAILPTTNLARLRGGISGDTVDRAPWHSPLIGMIR